MNDMRFKINSQNLDLVKILSSLGYRDNHNELNKSSFFQFLLSVDNSISREASDYIF